MANRDVDRLKHMLDSTDAILSFVKGKRRASLDKSRLLVSAIIRELEILGEAAARISEKTRKQFPELPWNKLIGMRNRLIHAYFDVDHNIVWKTAKEDLPTFRDILESIISLFEK